MSLFHRVLARVFRLPPAETFDLQVERNLRIPMPDGVVLITDHYAPRVLRPRPAVLIRSVYTDRTKGGWVSALIAERGVHVLVVSRRGTVGSGSTRDPFRHEPDDGLSCATWVPPASPGTSGAFPRWSRNLGTGEPALTATTIQVGHQAIDHDLNRPSAITLPIVD